MRTKQHKLHGSYIERKRFNAAFWMEEKSTRGRRIKKTYVFSLILVGSSVITSLFQPIIAYIYKRQLDASYEQLSIIKQQLEVEHRPWLLIDLSEPRLHHTDPVDHFGHANPDTNYRTKLAVNSLLNLENLGSVPASDIKAYITTIKNYQPFQVHEDELVSYCKNKPNMLDTSLIFPKGLSKKSQDFSTLDGNEVGAGEPNLRHGVAAMVTPELSIYVKIVACVSYINSITNTTHDTAVVYDLFVGDSDHLNRGQFENDGSYDYKLLLQPIYNGYAN